MGAAGVAEAVGAIRVALAVGATRVVGVREGTV